MPFGKHKDVLLKDVPRDYLLWLNDTLRRGDWVKLRIYIADHILNKAKEEPELLSDRCGATPIEQSDDMGICPECKEHCEYTKE